MRRPSGLVDRLSDWPVTRILSSLSTRCLQTVAPLAADRGLEIETVEALAVDGDARRVLRMLIVPALATAVLCTPGEVIGAVLNYTGEAGLRLLDPPQREKGSRLGCGGRPWATSGGALRRACATAGHPLRLLDDQGSKRGRQQGWVVALRAVDAHQLGMYHFGLELGEGMHLTRTCRRVGRPLA